MAYPPGGNIKSLGLIAVTVKVVSGAASRAAGAYTGNVELTTSTAHGKSVGDYVTVSGVTGTTESNGTHLVVEVRDTTHLTLDVVFANAFAGAGILTSPTQATVNYSTLVSGPIAGSGALAMPCQKWVMQALTTNTGKIWVGVVPNMDRTTGFGVIASRTAGGIVESWLFGAPNAFDIRQVWIDAEVSGEGVYGSMAIH